MNLIVEGAPELDFFFFFRRRCCYEGQSSVYRHGQEPQQVFFYGTFFPTSSKSSTKDLGLEVKCDKRREDGTVSSRRIYFFPASIV